MPRGYRRYHNYDSQPRTRTESSHETIVTSDGENIEVPHPRRRKDEVTSSGDEDKITYNDRSFEVAPDGEVEVIPEYIPSNISPSPPPPPKTDPKSTQHNARWTRILSLILGLSIFMAVILLIVYLSKRDEYSVARSDSTPQNPNFQETVTTSQLLEHNSESDCWLVLHGDAYDLTEYALEHPGGPEFITDFCGMDATTEYDIEHPQWGLLLLEVKWSVFAVYTGCKPCLDQ